MRYYGNVILHLQQYSHRLNLFYFNTLYLASVIILYNDHEIHNYLNNYPNIGMLRGSMYKQLLTLRLLMSYIYGVPSKARNANVVYIRIYVWQR